MTDVLLLTVFISAASSALLLALLLWRARRPAKSLKARLIAAHVRNARKPRFPRVLK